MHFQECRLIFDDFFVYHSWILHLEMVEEGFERLNSLGGRLEVEKYHISESKVVLLGYVVFKREIEANF